MVNGLYHGSDAEKAGLKGGDRIVEFNGKDVKSLSEVEQEALYENAGEVNLKVESPQRKSVKHLRICHM